MNVTNEIKNKEKTLTELMVKILKDPLDPLKGSMKKLHEYVLDTKDKVEEINDILNTAASTEDIIKPLGKTLRELQDDDIPQAISSLQKFILQQVEEKKQDISTSLSQQSAHYDGQLKNATGEVIEKLSNVLGQQNDAIQRYQKTGIDGAEALLQQLQAVNQSLEDASTGNASEQRSTRERDQRLAERLEYVIQAQQQIKLSVCELKQSMSELDQQLKGVSQSVQTARTTLAERQESDQRELLSGLETLSSDVQAAKSHLEAQIAASQGRFRYVVIIFALFATSTLAYIGYDIWKNLAP
ncbi:TPA: hypothetical protein ACKP1B_005524 [Serratia fonticola]